MPNTQLTRLHDLPPFRKMAIGTWRRAGDPSVYGALALDVDPMLAWIERFRERTGLHMTLTHAMAKAVGICLAEMPEANAMVRFGRIYLRRDVDVFFQVFLEDPVTGRLDLSGLTIRRANEKPMVEIVEEFARVAARVRAGQDEEKEQSRQTFRWLPGWLAGPALELIGTLLYTFNLDLRWLGLPRDPFGSVMVTNIGSLGLEEAYVPLVPYSRVPLLLAMGAVKRVPVVLDDGTLGVARQMRVFATFDHRLLDGAHAARMARTLTAVFADPDAHLGPLPPAP